jgi:hypothetical protein
MTKFETGKTYATRSICNHDCIIEIRVIKRTAKTIIADCGSFRGEKRLRISEYEGVEQVKPWGSYSMAPIIGADDQQ